MLRWLFECLEQRVERAGREHVNLVDDVHLSLALRGQELHRFSDFTDLFDAVIARTIDLEDVDR